MRVEIEATNLDTGKVSTAVAIFHEVELAVILFEAITNQRRPPDWSWQAAWAEIEEHCPESAPDFRAAAKAAMQYFSKQVSLAGRRDDEAVQ